MFQIKIHATGSTGNAYSIIDGDHKILIDPGIRFKELQKATGFSLSKYDFCLLSHEHKDHSKSIKEVHLLGLECLMSSGTVDALGLSNIILCLKPKSSISRPPWRILPFKTQHDAAEPLGFLIESPSGKKICYATDTCYLEYNFSGVTHWMIEANYSEELLQKNTTISPELKRRIRMSHFEISNVVSFFKTQDLSITESIYLIHLSDENSNDELFRREIEIATGLPIST